MSFTEAILAILGTIAGVGVWTVYGYLKKLPDRLHQSSLTKSEYGLKTDLELSKISQAELQIHKTKEFLEFTSYFNEILTHPQKLAQLEKDSKKQSAFKQRMLDLGARLYFFGSDDTIRTYLEFRRLGSGDQTAQSRMEILRTYGRLMLQMRRDLGYSNTTLDEEDYLRLIIIDWDHHTGTR